MKLLTRTTIYFFVIAIAVFSLGGAIFYDDVHNMARSDADERLHDEAEKIEGYVESNRALPSNQISVGDSVAFAPATGPVEEQEGRYRLYNAQEEEYEMCRTLTFTVKANEKFYKATLYRPVIENDDIMAGIIKTTAIIVSCLLTLLLLANFLISKILWAPFYQILTKVNTFNLSKKSHITPVKTNTAEFNMLSDELVAMTEKIIADYDTLKQFTENASHELQTPLAVIISKIELMMQEEKLSAKQVDNMQTVYESAGRLSKLNQALILLTRIENKQFPETKAVDLDKIVLAKLNMFEELIRYKTITVEQDIEPVQKQMHPVLADILIGNLIGNAIKHNVNSGKLYVELTKNRFEVRNSGPAPAVFPDKMFERFSKSDPNSDSLGLGLAIVKEICQLYGFTITYTYNEASHCITVSL